MATASTLNIRGRRPFELDVTDQTIETRAQIVQLEADGILRARTKPNVDLNLEDARAIIPAISTLCDGVRRPILVDLTGIKSMTREARVYFAGPETAAVESAAALLVASPIARAVGNFFIGFNKALIPARLFTSEPAALEWLAQFLPSPEP